MTDHKPLLGLFGEKPSSPMASAKVARWQMILAAYDYTIEYKEGKKHLESKHLDESFAPYIQKKDELSVEDDVVLWGHRVVIPQDEDMRQRLVKELHYVGHGLKDFIQILKGTALVPLDNELKTSCEIFVDLTELHWHEKVYHALRMLKSKRRNNPRVLPLTKDVAAFSTYLKDQVNARSYELRKASSKNASKRGQS